MAYGLLRYRIETEAIAIQMLTRSFACVSHLFFPFLELCLCQFVHSNSFTAFNPYTLPPAGGSAKISAYAPFGSRHFVPKFLALLCSKKNCTVASTWRNYARRDYAKAPTGPWASWREASLLIFGAFSIASMQLD